MAVFRVNFSETNAKFNIGFGEEKSTFTVEMAETQVIEIPIEETYSGPYTVTPKETEQSLETAHKYMEHNVDVHAIPYYEVSNTSGGNTVYIGSEVE